MTEPRQVRTWRLTAMTTGIVNIETPDDIDVLEVKYDLDRRVIRVTFSSASDFPDWNNTKVQVHPTNQP